MKKNWIPAFAGMTAIVGALLAAPLPLAVRDASKLFFRAASGEAA